MTTIVNNPNQNKYFIYARKSTDVEEKQVQSIEGQLDELHLFAKREGLIVVEEFVEKQSAKIPGRPVFNNMISRIERGQANGILSWHPDRLARNSVDGGKIIYLIDTGKISALKFNTFWFEPTPQGKFMLSISFGQSKYYVDSLSENTRRGLHQKARNGYFPGVAPLGYLNDSRNKTIVVNKKVAPIITKAFEMYGEGNIQIKEVASFLEKQKVLRKNGKRIREDVVTMIFKKLFYTGLFTYAGEIYEGRHDPIISKKLFDKVQEVLKNRNHQWSKPPDEKVLKPLLGLLRCGECGMMISTDFKVKHYVNGNCGYFNYYRCSKKNKSVKCQQPHIRDIELEPQLTALLKKYTLRKDWANQMLLKLKKEESDISQSSLEVNNLKHRQVEAIDVKLKLLLDSYLDQIIDKETFQENKFQLVSQKKTFEEQIINNKKHQGSWIEPMKQWVLEAQTVQQVAESVDLQLKKVLAAKIFGSNLFLENKKVRGDGIMAWSLRSDPPARELAVRVGFEPTTAKLTVLVFKTNLIDHSSTSPYIFCLNLSSL